MVTIKDIAKQAGVHVTTVSGILNGSRSNSRASAATEAKVRAIAAELGYVPNRAARQLRQGKTHSIGLVAGDIRNPFFAELAARLEELLHKEGYELLISCRGGEALLDVLAKAVDGCLIWAEASPDDDSPPLPAGQAVVYLGTGPEGTDRVDIDIAKGMKRALRFLADLGCQAPAFFAPESANKRGLPVPRAELFRTLAWDMGFRKGGGLYVHYPEWNLKEALRAAREILATDFTEDSVLAFNDVYAQAWLMAAEEAGCEVPLVSFDGTPWIAQRCPPVPHVKFDVNKIAEAAAELLLRRLRDPAAPPETRHISPRWFGG